MKQAPDGVVLTEQEQKELPPSEMVKMVMTRGKDDDETLYDLLGTKEYRKELDKQFKNAKSNFKIAIVVDMWLTGFDVPNWIPSILISPYKNITLSRLFLALTVNWKAKAKD